MYNKLTLDQSPIFQIARLNSEIAFVSLKTRGEG